MAGLGLTALAAAVGLTGIDGAHFWLTLILLGVGWNFGFVGASALVLECHRPEEKTRVQSLNDFIVFGTMAIGSFASGGLLAAYDWDTVLWVSFAPLVLAIAALAVAARYRRRSEEHTSELQSLMRNSYAVFCLQKKTQTCDSNEHTNHTHKSLKLPA